MVYDTQAVPEYKKDGWRWQKRKDKSGRVSTCDPEAASCGC